MPFISNTEWNEINTRVDNTEQNYQTAVEVGKKFSVENTKLVAEKRSLEDRIADLEQILAPLRFDWLDEEPITLDDLVEDFKARHKFVPEQWVLKVKR